MSQVKAPLLCGHVLHAVGEVRASRAGRVRRVSRLHGLLKQRQDDERWQHDELYVVVVVAGRAGRFGLGEVEQAVGGVDAVAGSAEVIFQFPMTIGCRGLVDMVWVSWVGSLRGRVWIGVTNR